MSQKIMQRQHLLVRVFKPNLVTLAVFLIWFVAVIVFSTVHDRCQFFDPGDFEDYGIIDQQQYIQNGALSDTYAYSPDNCSLHVRSLLLGSIPRLIFYPALVTNMVLFLFYAALYYILFALVVFIITDGSDTLGIHNRYLYLLVTSTVLVGLIIVGGWQMAAAKNPLVQFDKLSAFSAVCVESHMCGVCYRNYTSVGRQYVQDQCPCAGVSSCYCTILTNERFVEDAAHRQLVNCLCRNSVEKGDIWEYIHAHSLPVGLSSPGGHYIMFPNETDPCEITFPYAW